jgi:hypothetical protein
MGAGRARRALVLMTAAGLTAWPATASTPAVAGPAEPEQPPRLVRPVPIPLVEPRGPEPAPMPLAEPRKPRPVPMPRLQDRLAVGLDELVRQPR